MTTINITHPQEDHDRHKERHDADLTALIGMKPKEGRDYIKTLTTKQALGALAFAVCWLLAKAQKGK